MSDPFTGSTFFIRSIPSRPTIDSSSSPDSRSAFTDIFRPSIEAMSSPPTTTLRFGLPLPLLIVFGFDVIRRSKFRLRGRPMDLGGMFTSRLSRATPSGRCEFLCRLTMVPVWPVLTSSTECVLLVHSCGQSKCVSRVWRHRSHLPCSPT